MVTLTQKAAQKVKFYLEQENLGKDGFLRVSVQNSGCAGFSYDLQFDNHLDPNADETFEQDGIKVVIDKQSLAYLDGTTIDYVENLTKAGFAFNNPKSTGGCSCGSSFST